MEFLEKVTKQKPQDDWLHWFVAFTTPEGGGPSRIHCPRLGQTPVCRNRRAWIKSTRATGEMIPPQPDKSYLVDNHLWNAAASEVKLQAARNEFVAFQVCFKARRQRFVRR